MSVKEARERVRLFKLTAAAKPKAKGKAKPKAKNPAAFHDKLDGKLEKLAKRHGVSIRLVRNKTKMSNIVVGKLSKKPYGEVVKLFNDISHTSPVPQKMSEKGASFRVFGPRKMTALDDGSNEKVYMVVGKGKNGPAYWTDHGFISGNGAKMEAALLDEETADKVIRRNSNKHKDVTDLKAVPYDGDISKITANINSLRAAEEPGEDGETSDNYEGTEDQEEDSEYEDDGEDDSADDEAAIDSLISFINDNKISRDALNRVFDAALVIYANDLKTNGPIDDAVGFIYDTLGPDDANAKIKSLANTQSNPSTGV